MVQPNKQLITSRFRFCIEVQGGTNNKSVPFKVTAAWVGPQPNEKNKAAADMTNPDFKTWSVRIAFVYRLYLCVISEQVANKAS